MDSPQPQEPLAERARRLAVGDATVGVVGLGAVGLPVAALFARAGCALVLHDVDAARVGALREGRLPLAHLAPEVGAALLAARALEASTDPASLAACDAVLLCVPTPLGADRTPDLGPVEAAVAALAPHVAPGALVVLESTTWPGTTRERVAPPLVERGALVAYSPERVDPGRRTGDPLGGDVPKLVAGLDEDAATLARALYGAAHETVVPVGAPEVAEAAKLVENVFRAVNIALVNELKMTFGALGLDVWEVLDAAATKPFGFTRFDPGPGMGGHCIPVDPFYLAWAARRAGAEARFVELAGEINRRVPRWVAGRVADALGGSVEGKRVLLLGLAYKPDVDVVEESPALALLALLSDAGARVAFSDPHVPRGPDGLASVPLDAETLAAQDAVVVVTHHAAFDWDLVAEHARLVVDTRHVLADRMAGDPRYVPA